MNGGFELGSLQKNGGFWEHPWCFLDCHVWKARGYTLQWTDIAGKSTMIVDHLCLIISHGNRWACIAVGQNNWRVIRQFYQGCSNQRWIIATLGFRKVPFLSVDLSNWPPPKVEVSAAGDGSPALKAWGNAIYNLRHPWLRWLHSQLEKEASEVDSWPRKRCGNRTKWIQMGNVHDPEVGWSTWNERRVGKDWFRSAIMSQSSFFNPLDHQYTAWDTSVDIHLALVKSNNKKHHNHKNGASAFRHWHP